MSNRHQILDSRADYIERPVHYEPGHHGGLYPAFQSDDEITAVDRMWHRLEWCIAILATITVVLWAIWMVTK
jgi:hypothetical protein